MKRTALSIRLDAISDKSGEIQGWLEDISNQVQALKEDRDSIEHKWLEDIEALRLAQRQVLIYELAAKGQGLDDNDIPYDLPIPADQALAKVDFNKPLLTEYGAPGIVVSLAFLERMYNALPMLQQLPQRCYGGTLGDEYRALIANKGH